MPQIKTTDQTYVTDAGKPIVMAVPYSAYPQAVADWLYSGVSLAKDQIHTSADRTELRLKDPKKSDEGRYKVIIKNKHGQGEAFINLEVIGKLGCFRMTLFQELGNWICPCVLPRRSRTGEEPAGDRHGRW